MQRTEADQRKEFGAWLKLVEKNFKDSGEGPTVFVARSGIGTSTWYRWNDWVKLGSQPARTSTAGKYIPPLSRPTRAKLLQFCRQLNLDPTPAFAALDLLETPEAWLEGFQRLQPSYRDWMSVIAEKLNDPEVDPVEEGFLGDQLQYLAERPIKRRPKPRRGIVS